MISGNDTGIKWYKWLVMQDPSKRTMESAKKAVYDYITKNWSMDYVWVCKMFFDEDTLSYSEVSRKNKVPISVIEKYVNQMCQHVTRNMYTATCGDITMNTNIKYIFSDNVKILDALENAKLNTVSDIWDYYQKHKTLTTVTAIGPVSEKVILERISSADGVDAELPNRIKAEKEQAKLEKYKASQDVDDEVAETLFRLANFMRTRDKISESEAIRRVRAGCRHWLK